MGCGTAARAHVARYGVAYAVRPEADGFPSASVPPSAAMTWTTNIEEVREPWERLGNRSGNPFLSWEWASTWWRYFGKDANLRVKVCEEPGGTVVALLPLYKTSFHRVPALRFIGHGPGDQLGPVCAPEDRAVAEQALRGLVHGSPVGAALLIAEGLPGNEGWDRLLGGAILDQSPSPVLAARGLSWEQFLGSRSRNFRQQVRSRERRLAEAHDLAFRLADHATIDADFEVLVRLHESRWEGTSSVFAGNQRAFQRDVARAMLGAGRLRLWVLELDGEPVAAWEGFRMGGAEWYYQSGRDARFDRERPGFVLLCHTIREALSDGLDEYRFLLGGEGYKDRFANSDPGLISIAAPTSVLGRSVLGAHGTRRLVRATARKLARRDG